MHALKSVGIILVLLGLSSGCGYNSAVSAEASIQALNTESANTLDASWKVVQDSYKVAEAERESFQNAVVAGYSAQNPGDGSALMQWTQNAQIDPNPEAFLRVQEQIQAGRSSFRANQARMLDRQRAYRAQLRSIPNGPILRALGFPNELPACVGGASLECPKGDTDGDGRLTVLDYTVIVSTSTATVYATGIDDRSMID